LPPVFRPESCPRCGTRFAFGYAERRAATTPWTGRLILVVGLIAALLLTVLAFVLLATLVWSLTEGTDLPYQDKGILFFFAYVLIGLPLSLAPALLGWRTAFRMSRVLRVRCPEQNCGWAGKCRVVEEKELPCPRTDNDGNMPRFN
jgi:hypothetical protein